MRTPPARTAAAVVAAAVLAAGVYGLTRPYPRAEAPLVLTGDGVEGPSTIRDRRGRVIMTNIRTVEPRVLYRGSAFPTSFGRSGGKPEYADETAFEFLRARNIRHVIALVDTPETYYAEDGYLRFWSGRTGFAIDTTWVQIDPTDPFVRDDRGGLKAAGILIALMRENIGRGGAVYIHDLDGVSHAAVAAAGYELWRNRGWNTFDDTWTLVERRFMAGNTPERLRGLRSLREDLRFLIEL